MPTNTQVREEQLQELWGIDMITRENFQKAFGMSSRAIQIREYVYAKTGIKRGLEVDFSYTARVLCTHMPGLKQPVTSADLVNRGASLQAFVGLLDHHEVILCVCVCMWVCVCAL
jgi:hypothetical protein